MRTKLLELLQFLGLNTVFTPPSRTKRVVEQLSPMTHLPEPSWLNIWRTFYQSSLLSPFIATVSILLSVLKRFSDNRASLY